jgi:hypothetical protein
VSVIWHSSCAYKKLKRNEKRKEVKTMKAWKEMLAVALLLMFFALGCATMSPKAIEVEEEEVSEEWQPNYLRGHLNDD